MVNYSDLKIFLSLERARNSPRDRGENILGGRTPITMRDPPETRNYSRIQHLEDIFDGYDPLETYNHIHTPQLTGGIHDHYGNLNNHLLGLKEKGKKHPLRYFAKQATLMAGLPNLQLAGALLEFQEGRIRRAFGVKYLGRFVKQGVELSDEELGRYALRQDIKLDNGPYGNHFGHKYFDTRFNFCLTYDNQLIASVGFDAAQGRMHIRQIQGIKGSKDQLKPIKWERALASYAVQWAKEHKIPEVSIVSVDNIRWVKIPGHLGREQGRMHYDVTARRIGFKKRGKDGNYVKQLEVLERMPIPIPETVPAYAQAVNF